MNVLRKELCKTGSIKIWLYNPQISPKSARDLYINDIKIGSVFAQDKLCSCSAVFFSFFQRCSMNDSSQQWLTRPVSSAKVTVNSWKIEPLLCQGKNKAPQYTDREGEEGVSRERTHHPALDARTQNIKPYPPETFVWHWWASIIQSELWSSALTSWSDRSTKTDRSANKCSLLYYPVSACWSFSLTR